MTVRKESLDWLLGKIRNLKGIIFGSMKLRRAFFTIFLILPKWLITKITGSIISNGNNCELQLYMTLLKCLHYALWPSTGKFFIFIIFLFPIFILITLFSRSEFTSIAVHQIESVKKKNIKPLQVFAALTDGKIIFCGDYLHSFPRRAHSVR